MRSLLLVSLLLPAFAVAAYPDSFSWGRYVSPAGDQIRLGPCYTFAATGAVAAVRDLSYGPPWGTGSHTAYSERQVYSCAHSSGAGSIQVALDYLKYSGAVSSSCIAYNPTGAACSQNADQEPNRVILTDFDCPAELVRCGTRARAEYEDISSQMTAGAVWIQSTLINRGPIALSLEGSVLHGGSAHGYVLYGWTTEGGKLKWLLRDSWPCFPGVSAPEEDALHLSEQFQTTRNKAFLITRVVEERYSSGAWLDVTPAGQVFELEPENQVARIVATPGCYNQGTYSVTGLESLPGASVAGWSMRSGVSGGASLGGLGSASASLGGDGEDVTIVATIQRQNGWRENVTRFVGTVGVPLRIDTYVNGCAGTRREVGVSASALGPAGSASSAIIHAPESTDGSYYVINNHTSSPYFVFNRTTAVTYRVSVTSSSPGCSRSYEAIRYVIGYPCFTYPPY